jgi:WD40 repeat protein
MDCLKKIAMASDDHQITFYGKHHFKKDSTSLEKCFCLDLQNVNPLSLHFYNIKNTSESMLLYSTDYGSVNVFQFNHDRMATVAVKHSGLVHHVLVEKDGPTKVINELGTITKRKAHRDWATQVEYIPELRLIISCSPHPIDSLSVAELDINHKWQYHICSVHKGINAFAFSLAPICIITGGSDRNLRIWNPHRLISPISTMSGHLAPILGIKTNQTHGHIISMSSDKVVKIWDIRNQNCLQTISFTNIQKPDDTLSTLLYIHNSRGEWIITTSNTINTNKLVHQSQSINKPKSHANPINGVIYNSTFDQLVSGCGGGTVNVWDYKTGQKNFSYSNTHNGTEITFLTFDALQRRLITGGRGIFYLN